VLSRKTAGYVEGIVSIIVNTVLFMIKYLVGVMYNSIAVITESIHTLSDSLTSAVVVVAFWIAYKPPDEEHPFGHGRAESVGSVIIGTLLAVTAYELFNESVRRYLSGESMIFNWVLVVVLSVSVIIKELLARWSLRLGVKYDSKALVGDAWHHRSDAILSALVCIGILFSNYYWWVDSVLGMVVSVIIMFVAIKLIITTSKDIMGSKLPSKLESEVKEIISSISKDISDIHHIHMHKYGEHTEITLHIRLPPNMKLSEAHEIASKVEGELKKRYGWEVTVHIEPIKE
jgi:cation diffusion facilitator family transporter